MAPRRGKRNGWRQPPGILERGEVNAAVAGLFLGRLAGGDTCSAGRAVEALFNFSDQIFEIVDLAGEFRRLPLLYFDGLLGLYLLLLTFLDQQCDALALFCQRRNVALQTLLLLDD